MAVSAYYPRARVLLEVLLEDFGDGSDETVHTLDLVPRSIEVTRNGPREADKARVELSYRLFPLDPRAVRGVLVHGFLGDVGQANVDLPVDSDRYLGFVGIVDEPSTTLEESGEVVVFECRDLTAFWLDSPWTAAIDIDRPLQDIVEEMVAAVTGASGLTLAIDGSLGTLRPADILGRTTWTPSQGDDAWTVLSDLCGSVGCFPVIDLQTLRITTAEDFVGERQAVMMYGDNVSRLTFRRNMVETTTAAVELLCWDEQAREERSARYPSSPAARKRLGLDGVKTATEPVTQHRLVGTYTQQQLDEMARQTWLEAARGQLAGELETREMVDGDAVTDLTQLQSGDVLTVNLGTADPSFFGSMSKSEAVAWLTAGPAGMDIAVAEALVASWRTAEDIKPWFYVARATHRWNVREGYALTVEFSSMVGDE